MPVSPRTSTVESLCAARAAMSSTSSRAGERPRVLSKQYFWLRLRCKERTCSTRRIMIQRAAHDYQHLVRVNRLCEIVIRTGFHRFNRRVHRFEGGEHDDNRLRTSRANVTEQVKSRHCRASSGR